MRSRFSYLGEPAGSPYRRRSPEFNGRHGRASISQPQLPVAFEQFILRLPAMRQLPQWLPYSSAVKLDQLEIALASAAARDE